MTPALKQGKPVPPEVLADYPDLAAKPRPDADAAHRAYEAIKADLARLSPGEVQSRGAALAKYPKAALAAVLKKLGYPADGSQKQLAAQLLDNLNSLKVSADQTAAIERPAAQDAKLHPDAPDPLATERLPESPAAEVPAPSPPEPAPGQDATLHLEPPAPAPRRAKVKPAKAPAPAPAPAAGVSEAVEAAISRMREATRGLKESDQPAALRRAHGEAAPAVEAALAAVGSAPRAEQLKAAESVGIPRAEAAKLKGDALAKRIRSVVAVRLGMFTRGFI